MGRNIPDVRKGSAINLAGEETDLKAATAHANGKAPEVIADTILKALENDQTQQQMAILEYSNDGKTIKSDNPAVNKAIAEGQKALTKHQVAPDLVDYRIVAPAIAENLRAGGLQIKAIEEQAPALGSKAGQRAPDAQKRAFLPDLEETERRKQSRINYATTLTEKIAAATSDKPKTEPPKKPPYDREIADAFAETIVDKILGREKLPETISLTIQGNKLTTIAPGEKSPHDPELEQVLDKTFKDLSPEDARSGMMYGIITRVRKGLGQTYKTDDNNTVQGHLAMNIRPEAHAPKPPTTQAKIKPGIAPTT